MQPSTEFLPGTTIEDNGKLSLENAPDIIESFIDEHHELFATAEAAWRHVRSCIAIILQEEMDVAGPVLAAGNRQKRKSFQRRVESQLKLPIKASQWRAASCYEELSALMHSQAEKDDASKLAYFTAEIDDSRVERQEQLLAQMRIEANMGLLPSESSGISEETFASLSDSITLLDDAYMYAYLWRDTALAKIETLLQKDDAVLPFVEHINYLAEIGESGLTPVPGLLELLATHVKQAGPRENILAQALERMSQDKHRYAPDFIRTCFERLHNENEQKGKGIFTKDLACALEGLRLVAGMRWPTLDAFAEDFAQETDNWPLALRQQLNLYSGNRMNQVLQEVTASLQTRIRLARIPSLHGAITQFAKNVHAPRQKKASELTLNSVREDVTDVASPEQDSPVITQFAVLKKVGTRQCRLVPCNDITTLMDSDSITRYIEKYQSDTTLRTAIATGIDYLARDPFGQGTCFAACLKFSVEVGKRNALYRLHRLTFQEFPYCPTGMIATKTRLLYAIVPVNNQPCLVVYGPVHKQEIDNSLTELPKLV